MWLGFHLILPVWPPVRPPVALLSACCRLLDLLEAPQDIPFLSGMIKREIIYRIFAARGEHAFERLQYWETRAIEPQKRSPGSGRTTPSRYGWKTSRKSPAWEYPRCTIISGY